MNRLFSFIRDRHALLYKGFLFLVSLATIVYLYPREFRFRYDLTDLKGKPWPHDNLIAPFDFAIKKSTDEINAEQEELKRNFTPYFRFEKATWAKEGEHKHFDEVMNSVLGRGVRAVTNAAGKGPQDEVLVVRDNIAEERRLGEFPDASEADSVIRARLTEYELEKYYSYVQQPLRANVVYDSALTNKYLRQALDNISPVRDALTKGQSIVGRGQLVNDEIYQQLLSLQDALNEQYQSGSNWQFVIGQILLAGFCLFILFQFLRLFRREMLGNDARLLFILLMLVLTVCMSYLPLLFEYIPMLARAGWLGPGLLGAVLGAGA